MPKLIDLVPDLNPNKLLECDSCCEIFHQSTVTLAEKTEDIGGTTISKGEKEYYMTCPNCSTIHKHGFDAAFRNERILSYLERETDKEKTIDSIELPEDF